MRWLVDLGVEFHRHVGPIVNELYASAVVGVVGRLGQINAVSGAERQNICLAGVVVPLVSALISVFARECETAASIITGIGIAGHRFPPSAGEGPKPLGVRGVSPKSRRKRGRSNRPPRPAGVPAYRLSSLPTR